MKFTIPGVQFDTRLSTDPELDEDPDRQWRLSKVLTGQFTETSQYDWYFDDLFKWF